MHQFLEIYRNFMPPWQAMTLAVALVVISQIKINVTNAYSGSLAWTNSFTRVTKHYPDRLVFLGVNLLIALVLMDANMFSFLNTILGFYANCGMSWVVTVASDIVINKYLLKTSPLRPEFRRGMLYPVNPVNPVNPVGFGSMIISAGVSIIAFFGGLGSTPQQFSPLVAIVLALVLPPVLALATRGRVLPAADRRRHRRPDVRRARRPVGQGHAVPRLRRGHRATRRGELRSARRGGVLAVPEPGQDRGTRAARPGLTRTSNAPVAEWLPARFCRHGLVLVSVR